MRAHNSIPSAYIHETFSGVKPLKAMGYYKKSSYKHFKAKNEHLDFTRPKASKPGKKADAEV
jgi:hypothetical protein